MTFGTRGDGIISCSAAARILLLMQLIIKIIGHAMEWKLIYDSVDRLVEIPHITQRSRKCHQDRKPNWIMAETDGQIEFAGKTVAHKLTHAAWWMFGMANRGVCLRPLGETTKGITAHWHLKSALSESISRSVRRGLLLFSRPVMLSARRTENHDAAAAAESFQP
jgi:hypothetical protein